MRRLIQHTAFLIQFSKFSRAYYTPNSDRLFYEMLGTLVPKALARILGDLLEGAIDRVCSERFSAETLTTNRERSHCLFLNF
jgi:hypothetical protein